MKRNIKKAADKGKKLLAGGKWDLGMWELDEILAMMHNTEDPDRKLNAIITAFYMGADAAERKAQHT